MVNLCHCACLPACPPAVSALVDLQLSCQEVTPQGLWAILQHTQLTRLSLSQCDISLPVPPLAAGALAALGQLCLPFNRSMDADRLLLLASPAQLTHLDLTACSLSQVPEEITALTALRSLRLGSNGNTYWKMPLESLDRLTGLGQLTLLNLGHTLLREVPQAVSALSALRSLSFKYDTNLRYAAPDSWRCVAACVQLTELDLQNCGLTQLPAALTALTVQIQI